MKNWKVVKMVSDANGREVRVLEADGKLYWQTQGSQHEIMPYTWGDGLIGLMPESMSVDDAIAEMLDDPMRFEQENADGILPYVPRALWLDTLLEEAIDQERLNDYYLSQCGELAKPRTWKIWKSTPQAAYWYIPEEDETPGDDNIIEGETGELFYLDAEDASLQWRDCDALAEKANDEADEESYKKYLKNNLNKN